MCYILTITGLSLLQVQQVQLNLSIFEIATFEPVDFEKFACARRVFGSLNLSIQNPNESPAVQTDKIASMYMGRPFKTSAVPKGGGVKNRPTFADITTYAKTADMGREGSKNGGNLPTS